MDPPAPVVRAESLRRPQARSSLLGRGGVSRFGSWHMKKKRSSFLFPLFLQAAFLAFSTAEMKALGPSFMGRSRGDRCSSAPRQVAPG